MVAEPSSVRGGINWGSTGTEPSQLTHDLLPHIAPNSTTTPGLWEEGMAAFLAAPTQAEGIATDPLEADGGMLKFMWRMRGILNNVGYSMKDTVDQQNKTAACLSNTLKSVADWATKMEERVALLESTRSGGTSTPWAKSISEVKAIQNLEQLGNDKGEFRNWMDRLTNALVQKDADYRILMNKIKETMDQKNKILSDSGPNDEVDSILFMAKMDRVKVEEDLYYILVEKTKKGSEAAQRVATVQPGQGLLALMKVYAWYAGTTGLALKRRTELVMSPPSPTREEDIANILEHWAEQVRMLANYGTAHKLPAAYKITALSQIMKNKKDKFEEFEDQARDQFPNDEETQFDLVFSKVMEFATRRRLEANQARLKGDLMDCNRVAPEQEQHQHQHQHQTQVEYPSYAETQYDYEGYDGPWNVNQTNYGGGLNPYNQEY
jgi:3-methyladenine DNA glycosylase AlkC